MAECQIPLTVIRVLWACCRVILDKVAFSLVPGASRGDESNRCYEEKSQINKIMDVRDTFIAA